MVNNQDFINRLKKVIVHHQLTASSFADKIEVQRSSISHILSGRNKPSLDFILKVTRVFTDVDIYWLLNGKGSFPKNSSSSTPTSTLEEKTTTLLQKDGSKTIKRIVVFYEDGTFDEFSKN